MYWYLDENDQVLYVGKAKNLKNRVSSYRIYSQLANRTRQLVATAKQLKFQVLESELEALLIEAELINTHQPPFNIALKDDKSPLYILITNEVFPRVQMVRKRDVQRQQTPDGTLLGPFTSAWKVREVLKIARQVFPWCANPQAGKACFYYHIQQCPGACVGEISQSDYQQNIQHLVKFLKGKKNDVIRDIQSDLKAAVVAEKYEQAARLRDSLSCITEVTKRNYFMRPNPMLPNLKINQAEESLILLRKLLRNHVEIPQNYSLARIEGYDVSNIQGTNAAVAMVTFIDGRSETDEYRLFNIKTLDTPNDYGMLQEALLRRQNHPEWGMPTLLVIDGGKGQLRAALSVWHWPVPVISIAKKPDRIIIPVGQDLRTQTTISEGVKKTKFFYHEIKLPESHLALKVIQQIRDESHRFSKKQHQRRREKHLFQ